MNLESVAQYLEAQKAGRRGSSIFVNEMPIECELGLLLRDRYSGTPIDPELPGWRDTGFRIAVRGQDYTISKALAWKVVTALTLTSETTMTGMLVKRMYATHEPRGYRRSKGGYWEWELDIETSYAVI